jgi:hypothetical protein
MNRELIRRKALLAASSVVLAAGLAACPQPKVEDTALADTSAETDTDTDTAPTCTEVAPSDTAEYFSCCDELRTWCDATHGVDTQAASDCTWGPGTDGSTGCIPWGPPVPPRMRAVA